MDIFQDWSKRFKDNMNGIAYVIKVSSVQKKRVMVNKIFASKNNTVQNYLRTINFEEPEWIPCTVSIMPATWRKYGEEVEKIILEIFPIQISLRGYLLRSLMLSIGGRCKIVTNLAVRGFVKWCNRQFRRRMPLYKMFEVLAV